MTLKMLSMAAEGVWGWRGKWLLLMGTVVHMVERNACRGIEMIFLRECQYMVTVGPVFLYTVADNHLHHLRPASHK